VGYSTEFKGELRFVSEPTAKQLAHLQSMFGEDCRDHPEWDASGLYYVDLELNDDFTGIRWNGAEKTYGLERIINVVLAEMRKQWPDFGLSGTLMAQGEDMEDRWALHIGEDGLAHKQAIAVVGQRVQCPHCGGKFLLESAAD
jgi:hypothetical protein